MSVLHPYHIDAQRERGRDSRSLCTVHHSAAHVTDRDFAGYVTCYCHLFPILSDMA